ncbi:MAG: T9SS type A sorting domain-containing protein [Bacteroidales bacterium]|nr:T9SS type A sorting domain-containing protein [Bacteroidales bacterium]
MRKILLLTIVMGFFYLGTNAQELIASSGNYSETANGSLSWSIGEPIIENAFNSDIILTQGFNQSKLTVTTINETVGLEMNISVYPNPTSDYLSIEAITDQQKEFQINLYDLSGKLILQKDFFTGKETINMKEFQPAIYILKICTNNTDIKTYKVIKQ